MPVKKLTYIVILLFIAASSLLLLSCSNDQSTDDPVEPAIGENGKIENNCGENSHQENADQKINKNLTDHDKANDIENDGQTDEAQLSEVIRNIHVGIYSGKGNWYESTEATKNFLNENDIKWSDFDEESAADPEELENFDLIWFPGGFAAEYKNFIIDHSAIINFVEDGGLFVGSCAGAYYASDVLKWEGTAYQYPLNLFEGKGIGPLLGQIAWGEIAPFKLDPDHPANRDFDEKINLYYFDGPYFAPYEEGSIEVLARYEVNSEPAVIAGIRGSGGYLLLGPHPELGGYTPEGNNFNLKGGEGAKWPWLYSVLSWFVEEHIL